MNNLSKLSVVLLVALFVAIGAGNALGAGTFPEKPIMLIVPYGSGCGSDLFARTLAAGVEKERRLPKPLIVENKPGGSGAIRRHPRGDEPAQEIGTELKAGDRVVPMPGMEGKMPLTRDVNETVTARVKSDPAFGGELIVEATNAFLMDDREMGKVFLRDYLNAILRSTRNQ